MLKNTKTDKNQTKFLKISNDLKNDNKTSKHPNIQQLARMKMREKISLLASLDKTQSLTQKQSTRNTTIRRILYTKHYRI